MKYLSEYTITCNVTNPWKDKEEDKEEKVTLNKDCSFKVSNDDYELWIDTKNYSGKLITENDSLCIDIEYEDCLHEKGKIEKILDLKEQQEIKINMKKREELKIEDKIFVLKSDKDDMSFKNFEVKVSSNGTKELKVKDKPKKKVESESKGEEPKVKDTKVEWLWRVVSFLVGVLVAGLVVLAGILLLDNQKGNGGGFQENDFSVNDSAVAPKDTSNSACIKYLKATKNNGLSKDSLDFYPLTRGLYDAMNEYNFETMKKCFGDIYRENKETTGGKFAKIVEYCNDSIFVKEDVKDLFKKEKEFEAQNKGTINLGDYLKKLKEVTSAKRSNSSSDKKQPKTNHAENKDSVESPMAGEDRNKEF